MKTEAQKVVQAMSPAQKLRAAERLYLSARQLKAAALRAEHPDWTTKPSVRPFARFSCMPEANLFLMFTQRRILSEYLSRAALLFLATCLCVHICVRYE